MNQEHLKKITTLRHQLHAHPELSMQEKETKTRLMAFLKENTKLELVDCGYWFYACYHCGRKSAEKIAFRADFDALPMEESIALSYASQNPGVSHKCGHDGHSAALAGMALELDEKGAGKDIYLIFQHGEEIGGGGEECARLIKEKGISQVYAFHNTSGYPEGSIILRKGTAQCASKGLTVCFQGVPSHASHPEEGRNPAQAVSKLALAIEKAVETTIEDRKIVLGTIVQIAVGSKNFGISASYGEISVTLRAERAQDMVHLEQQIRKAAEELARADDLTLSFEERDIFPDTVNDSACVEAVRRAAKESGFPVIDMPQPFRASEDFGYYLKQCPGAIFYIGNGEDYAPIHTSGFDFNDMLLETAVTMFWKLAGEA
ncbi:MAG: M20 family metallopeptidase [Lachnospiraceae bacterium]|nr:M20 family metallopeptidase [Lachnospiraceae bacterium]